MFNSFVYDWRTFPDHEEQFLLNPELTGLFSSK